MQLYSPTCSSLTSVKAMAFHGVRACLMCKVLLHALLRGCLSTNKVHAGNAQPGELHLLSRGGGTLLQANMSGIAEAALQCQLTPHSVCSVLHTQLDQRWKLLT